MSWPLDLWLQLSPHLLPSQANQAFCWAAGSTGWLFCLDGCWSHTVGLQRKSVTELEINSPPGGRQTLPGFYCVFPQKEPNCFHSSVQFGPDSGSWSFDIRREAFKEIWQANRFLFFATNHRPVEDTSWICGSLLCCGSWSNGTKPLLTGWERRVNNAAWHFRKTFANVCHHDGWGVEKFQIFEIEVCLQHNVHHRLVLVNQWHRVELMECLLRLKKTGCQRLIVDQYDS